MQEIEQYLELSPQVKKALEAKQPVVALESTIISHGFQYPENLECARQSEKNIRDYGAVPATIAIIGGKIKVGLSDEELLYLANSRHIPKCSSRDIVPLLALGKDGATTVTSTMVFAEMAGIEVFATGGIGGVHRRGNETFDISADLHELAKTNVAVVCAGAKSILDIPLTREYLETFGVTVLGYQTSDFPGFYIRSSGVKVDYCIQNPGEIARIIRLKNTLALEGGILITNPIPVADEMDPQFISRIIEESVAQAEEQGVKGKDITPFILERLHVKTGGKSVAANKALVFNNARLAAQIACELSMC